MRDSIIYFSGMCTMPDNATAAHIDTVEGIEQVSSEHYYSWKVHCPDFRHGSMIQAGDTQSATESN